MLALICLFLTDVWILNNESGFLLLGCLINTDSNYIKLRFFYRLFSIPGIDIEINTGLAIIPGKDPFRIWSSSNKIHHLLKSL